MGIVETIEAVERGSGLSNPVRSFTNGGCLWLAKELKRRFPEGEIVHLPEFERFVFELDGKLYDATGNASRTYRNARRVPLADVPEKILSGYDASFA